MRVLQRAPAEMPRQAPYLQRRGDTLFFRIAVPLDLRALVGGRELTRTLCTAEKAEAIPIALEFAATAKRLFYMLRASRVVTDDSKFREMIQKAKNDLRIQRLRDQHGDELIAQRLRHVEELKRAKLEAKHEALEELVARSGSLPVPTHAPMEENAPAATETAPIVTLGMVVDSFLDNYVRRKKPAMLRKHRPVLTMLLDVVGDKPITDIKQADINGFFELIEKLPPRWADACRQKGITVHQLAELEHEVTIGPKTFDDTYLASVRPFLKAAKMKWGDQGFPLGLSTEGVEYLGNREEGESKQRAFTLPELRRLFEGPEMKEFASDPDRAHYFWLPLVGLYTGARVNEICQLNPQTDILKDGSVDYFWITSETEADSRIKKTVKTGDSRQVPIHKKLLDLGFLAYVQKVKATGSKLLFPAWEPTRGRASGNAEKWFRRFLQQAGLRDETPGAMVLGMHVFRHTLLTYGAGQKPPLSLFCITGHAQDEAPIHATGAGKGYLTLSMLSPLSERAELLNRLDYGLKFATPRSG